MVAEASVAQPPTKPARARATPQAGRPGGRQVPDGPTTTKRGDVVVYLPNFKPHAKHPSFEIPLDVKTEAAFKVFLSTFDATQKSLYYLHCIFPIHARSSPEQINAVMDVIENRFTELDQDLSNELERLRHLAKTDGADLASAYFNDERMAVIVVTPAMSRFMGMIAKMDQIMRTIDALWFSTRIKEKDRNNRIMEWRNKLMRFHRFMVQTGTRAQSTAHRQETSATAELQVAGDDIALDAGDIDLGTSDGRKTAPRKSTPRKASKAPAAAVMGETDGVGSDETAVAANDAGTGAVPSEAEQAAAVG